jgi:CheY-like chemotaxis protein
MNETVSESSKLILDPTEKIRVLHVDADADFLKVAKQCLEIQAPLVVDTAHSVEEAFRKLETKRYDVIVSEYEMPVKDGLDFLGELGGERLCDSLHFVYWERRRRGRRQSA